MQLRSSTQLEAYLDKGNYNDEDLITIRVPFNVPYQAQVSTYERVSGEIELNGSTYRYVKRKFEKGQLVLLCIPDHNKTVLKTAKNEYASRVADIPGGNNKTGEIVKKQQTGSEYEELSGAILPIITSPYAREFLRGENYRLTQGFESLSAKPPQTVTVLLFG
ncbi:hypothetical protein QTN47_18300 [Danxiaibacter flavus]|uniref:Uncharacterized protein n=1 Tax=Danxiaibacter flavus TaxID=3049108 RepID=A0ABV3ZIS0_9BACT|nr:hypothetical protein QNM32_18310 [Chitinophagaceae bacterium DXS]